MQGIVETEEDSTRSVVVYLAQHPLLTFVRDGFYWPREAGWQTIHTSQGARAWWYVWKKDASGKITYSELGDQP